ncbi:hypothetical protein NYE44_01215 [Paenibacillus sp. FSL L8-0493]|uniref:hypothetical protein n=1 Tax=Paenibacillus TaxID=44249 RepID=UPI00096D840B|nr:hypothetical protein [Paenibacillus odorifer]OMD07941.1 hypothetical protein BJP47_09705 [Paenibacillus odorifer]OMD31847.1 hypothetical protein BJP48_14730 [Paenibacillus odorifer]OZQ74439.1 hypothetical protein CA596_17255 [Paenibacillus odorifer]
MRKNQLGYLILIIIIIGAIIAVIHGSSECQNKREAGSLGMDYVRKEYTESASLRVATVCKPLFGGSGYQVVLEDSRGQSYYVIIVLGTTRNLVTMDDLTKEVREGTSVFPCHQ